MLLKHQEYKIFIIYRMFSTDSNSPHQLFDVRLYIPAGTTGFNSKDQTAGIWEQDHEMLTIHNFFLVSYFLSIHF
jgi:hypothetical protein